MRLFLPAGWLGMSVACQLNVCVYIYIYIYMHAGEFWDSSVAKLLPVMFWRTA